MEARPSVPAFAAEPNTVKCYSKRNEATTVGLKRSALGRQTLSTTYFSHAPPCNGGFEIGAFYEIDHEKLPPKSPIQLKAIRVVKVSETTTLDVTVSFPSNRSLRHYFFYFSDERGPELDERFVMSSNHAGKILRSSIPRSQLEEERHLERFWLVTPGSYNLQHLKMSPSSVLGAEDVKSSQKAMSSCLLTLKHSGALGWGTRRKVKYIGRHRDHVPSPKEEDEVADRKEVKEEEEKGPSGSGCKRKRPPETSTGDEEEEEEEEKMMMMMKKKKNKKKKKKKKMMMMMTEKMKDQKKKNKGHNRKEAKEPGRLIGGVEEEGKKRIIGEEKRGKAGYKERWSCERYQAAELRLLDIMREKGAALGRPILRQALREEARKHIGDTGLLDHLLKHMAGKVVSQGKERFRRRHNAEGAMEYWLEPAELVEMRLMAGVMDPYWVPPPGWKLGDATSPCPCSSNCEAQLEELRGEVMRKLKREMEERLSSFKCLEKVALDIKSDVHSIRSTWQEKYEYVLNQNVKLEEEIAVISSSLLALKEDVRMLMEEEKERKRENKVGVVVEESCRERSAGEDNKRGDLARSKEAAEPGSTVTASGSKTTVVQASTVTANNANPAANDKCKEEEDGKRLGASGEVVSAAGPEKKKTPRKSGFKICKPQGTFLWPNMGGNFINLNGCGSSSSGGSSSSSIISSVNSSSGSTCASPRRPPLVQGVVVVPTTITTTTTAAYSSSSSSSACASSSSSTSMSVEEQVMMVGGVPTPPSVSSSASATTPPMLLLHLPTPPPPVLMRPPSAAAAAAKAAAAAPTTNYSSPPPLLPLPLHLQAQELQKSLAFAQAQQQQQQQLIQVQGVSARFTDVTRHSMFQHVPREMSSAARTGGGGSPAEGKNKWGSDTTDAAGVAWSNIVTTDLALATPSPR